MSRVRQCNNCGGKHLPPTGKNCQFVSVEEEEQDNVSTTGIHMAPSQEQPQWAQEVLAAVQAMGGRIADIETRLPSSTATAATPALPVAPAAAATSNPESHVTLEDLRRLEPLNLRVDNYLASQASSSNLVTDVLALSLGGKLLKNPRSSTVRRIRNPVLWPHQFIHRPGTAELSFDMLTLPEFVAGTCSILQLKEITSAEKDARLQHLHYLMLQARSYMWESLRSMYAAALEDIQYGQRSWQQPLSDLKEQLLTIEHLSNTKGTQPGKTASGNKPADPCRLYNYASCNRTPCPHPHRCYVCWRYHKEEKSHPAKECSRRAEYMAKNGTASALPNTGGT